MRTVTIATWKHSANRSWEKIRGTRDGSTVCMTVLAASEAVLRVEFILKYLLLSGKGGGRKMDEREERGRWALSAGAISYSIEV